MPGLILDCSLFASWLLPGERNGAASDILDRVTGEGALVPGIWRIEVLNMLLGAERRGRITSTDRARALAIAAQLPIDVDPETSEHAWNGIAALAERYQLAAYDGAYLELAHRTALPLATLDKDLRTAAAKLGVPLVII